MNRRLQQFLQAENISQAQLADTLKVARASVSNILSGRNKPGFEFLESLSLHYPDLNLEWLVTGRGKMYKGRQDDSKSSTSMQEAGADSLLFPPDEPRENRESGPDSYPMPESVLADDVPSASEKRVVKVIVFFDDNTFQEIIS